jgi:multiple sugar transport system permease protein
MNRDLAMVAAIIMAVWKQLGPNLLVFLAGLQTLPEEVFDAAKVDGANRLQNFWYITFPLLRPTTVFVGIMLIIGSLQNFTPMYVLTGGGPANVTRTIALLINQEGFQFFHMGKASAMATVMFAAVLSFSIINIRAFGERNK